MIKKKIAEFIYHRLRKTRYTGKGKSRFQALFTAAVVNLKRLFKEQEKEGTVFDLPGAIAALT